MRGCPEEGVRLTHILNGPTSLELHQLDFTYSSQKVKVTAKISEREGSDKFNTLYWTFSIAVQYDMIWWTQTWLLKKEDILHLLSVNSCHNRKYRMLTAGWREFENQNCQNKKFDLILSVWIEVWFDGFICTLLYLALFSKSFNLCQVENSFADFLDKTCLRKTYYKTLCCKMYPKI